MGGVRMSDNPKKRPRPLKPLGGGAIGIDFYNMAITGDKTMTLTGKATDPHHVPTALIPCYTLKIRGGVLSYRHKPWLSKCGVNR